MWHDGLLFKLDKLGINGKIWRIIKDSYTNIRCRVSINGLCVIKMTRGVRQGGVTSTGFYLVFADGLLLELEASGLGATLCSVRSGNPGFVDDLALIATSPAMLQKLLDIVNLYMLKWLIRIHTDKSCVLIFSNNKQIQVCNMFHISNDPIRQETSANYLGILQDSTLKSIKRTRERIQKGRNSFHAMVGYGVKPLGVSPLTAISMYRKITVPTVLYGCEVWNNLSHTESLELDRFQRQVAKGIQGFPIRTRTDICESMLGLYPISCEVIIRKMLFLHKLLSLPCDSVSHQIFLRKLYLFLTNSPVIKRGFVPDIC